MSEVENTKESCEKNNAEIAVPGIMLGGGAAVATIAGVISAIPTPQTLAAGAAISAAGFAYAGLLQKDCDVVTDRIQENVAKQVASKQQR
jgi:hypothetical protein